MSHLGMNVCILTFLVCAQTVSNNCQTRANDQWWLQNYRGEFQISQNDRYVIHCCLFDRDLRLFISDLMTQLCTLVSE